MDEIYRMASEPLAYSVVLAAIATLGVREAVAAADPAARWPWTGRVTFVLVVAAFLVIGVRLADLVG
jgi:hypothetical protein